MSGAGAQLGPWKYELRPRRHEDQVRAPKPKGEENDISLSAQADAQLAHGKQ